MHLTVGDAAFFAPQYAKMDPGDLYGHEIGIEYTQCFDEGLEVAPYKPLFDEIAAMPACEARETLADGLFRLLRTLPTRKDYPYTEPSDLSSILALRDGNARTLKKTPDADVLHDKLGGAWYGRVVGCLLGKTIEGIRSEELLPLLRQSGNWPMHRYVRSSDPTSEMLENFRYDLKHCVYADRIDCAPADDDTNYVFLAQYVIERHGKDFTSDDVANAWLRMQPKSAYFTAERAAFSNFERGIFPPTSAEYKNKFREYIGAQIRADYYGYICPGDPERAAALAFRDARISHVKNGIYGAMFVAAMIAAAAVTDDVREIIRQGLAQIPRTSRLYACLTQAVRAFEDGQTMEAQVDRLRTTYDEHTSYGWCHVISNAWIVALALLYGRGDFAKSVCLAVQTGFDTDCNGATVGSVVGMLCGRRRIPPEWTAPLGGRLQTELVKFGTVELETCIHTTIKHAEANQ